MACFYAQRYQVSVLEVVDKFFYLGNLISAGGGAVESLVARAISGWKKVRDLLSVLTCRGLSFHSKGRVYQVYVRSYLQYGSETWAVKEADLFEIGTQ